MRQEPITLESIAQDTAPKEPLTLDWLASEDSRLPLPGERAAAAGRGVARGAEAATLDLLGAVEQGASKLQETFVDPFINAARQYQGDDLALGPLARSVGGMQTEAEKKPVYDNATQAGLLELQGLSPGQRGDELLTTKIAEGAGSTVPFAAGGVVGGAVGGSAKAAQLAVGIQGALSGYHSSYYDAVGRGATPEQAFTAGLAGAAGGSTEMLGAGDVLAKLGAKLALADKATGGAMKTGFLHWLLEAGKQGAEEAVQETAQNTIQAATNQYLELTRPGEAKDFIGAVVEAAKSGGLPAFFVGALFGGVGSIVEHATTPERKKRAQEIVNEVAQAAGELHDSIPDVELSTGAELAAGSEAMGAQAEADAFLTDSNPSETPNSSTPAQEATGSTPAPDVSPPVAESAPQSAAVREEAPAPKTFQDRITERRAAAHQGELGFRAYVQAIGGLSMKHETGLRGELEAYTKKEHGESRALGLGPIVHGEKSSKGMSVATAVERAIQDGILPPDATERDFLEGLETDSTVQSAERKMAAAEKERNKQLDAQAQSEGYRDAADAMEQNKSDPTDPWGDFSIDKNAPGEGEGPTGIKNASVDAELKKMDALPAEGRLSRKDAEVHARAKAKFDADHEAGRNLLHEIEDTGRVPSDDDWALLLLEANRRRIVFADAAKEFLADPSPENESAKNRAFDDYREFDRMKRPAGSEAGASLRMLRAMVNWDFSPAAMEMSGELAKGEPLTREESVGVQESSKRIKELLDTLDQERADHELKQATLQAENAMLRSKRRAAKPERQAKIVKAKAEFDDLLKQFVALGKQANMLIGPEHIALLTKLARKGLEIGYHEFAKWAESVKAAVGEEVEPHLRAAWDAAKKERDADFVGKLKTRLESGKKITELGRYIRKIGDSFVEQGITEVGPLAEHVHEVLKTVAPDITRREVMESLGGYGEFKRLSTDEVARTKRDLRGQARELSKLADLANRLPPEKSGLERAEPTGPERRLRKRVREWMKKLGINPIDPEKQIKGTLEAQKTRLRNSMDDMQTAIDTGEKIVAGERVKISDAELEALKAEKDALKAQYDATFPEPVPDTPDPAIKRLQDQVDALSAKIAAGDLSTRPEKQGPDIEAVDKLKKQRDALNEKLAEMRRAAKPKPTQAELDARTVANATKAIEKSIADYERRIAEGDLKAKEHPEQPTTPELEALRARRDALSEELADLREAANPKMTPEQRAIKARKTRDANRLARLKERNFYGEYEDPSPGPKKEPLPLSPGEAAVRAEIEVEKRKHARQLETWRLARRTNPERAWDAAKLIVRTHQAWRSAVDFSAVMTHGGPLVADPKTWASLVREHFPRMFRSFGVDNARAEKFFQETDQQLRADKTTAEAINSWGLELTEIDGSLSKGEESIKSDWSDHLPLVRRSNRAFVMFLNSLRSWAIKSMVKSMPGEVTTEQGKELARIVNIFTGRGQLGHGKLEAAAETANLVLWATKLYTARFQIIAEPLRQGVKSATGKGDAEVQKLIAKQYARSILGAAALYTLATVTRGAFHDDDDKRKLSINLDPRKPNPFKVKYGNSYLDPLSGISQSTTLVTRLTASEDPWRVASQFLQYKVKPWLGAVLDLKRGKSVVGEKVTPEYLAWSLLSPMSIDTIYHEIKEHGVPDGTALGLASMFGVSVQTHMNEADK